jgi:hypothetical protein
MARREGGTLFSYTDKDGVDVVVDRLEDVPQQYRGKMKVTTLDGTSAEVTAPMPTKALPAGVDPTSVAAGALGGIVIGFLLGRLRGKARIASGLVTLIALLLLGTLYLTYLRSQTGAGGRLSTPAAVIGDAQRAKLLMEQHQTSQQKALDAIERSEK